MYAKDTFVASAFYGKKNGRKRLASCHTRDRVCGGGEGGRKSSYVITLRNDDGEWDEIYRQHEGKKIILLKGYKCICAPHSPPSPHPFMPLVFSSRVGEAGGE